MPKQMWMTEKTERALHQIVNIAENIKVYGEQALKKVPGDKAEDVIDRFEYFVIRVLPDHIRFLQTFQEQAANDLKDGDAF